MSLAKKEKTFLIHCMNLKPAVDEVMNTFKEKGFEAIGEQKITGGWHISLHKGGIFKTVIGMKTSLNIEIDRTSNGVDVKESVGIFGEQAIPTAITMLVFWPVLITQIWGLVEQNRLDDEVMNEIENSLTRHQVSDDQIFCVSCGKPIPHNSKFCLECGVKVEV